MKTKTIAEMCGAAEIDRAATKAELAQSTQVLEIGGLTFFVRYEAPTEAGQDAQQPSIHQEN
ncbi:hypothetical protein [Pseudoduganella sp. RAF53_2]|uniref:hypothetical protein n=1 Tax=unclassified Pseudoduganella TaxID=2637179 RepID=UPI003F95F13D